MTIHITLVGFLAAVGAAALIGVLLYFVVGFIIMFFFMR